MKSKEFVDWIGPGGGVLADMIIGPAPTSAGTEFAFKGIAIKCSETPVVIYLEKYRKAKTARTALQEDRAWIKAKVMAAVSTMSCLERACEPSTRRYADLRHIDLGSDIARIQALVTQF